MLSRVSERLTRGVRGFHSLTVRAQPPEVAAVYHTNKAYFFKNYDSLKKQVSDDLLSLVVRRRHHSVDQRR